MKLLIRSLMLAVAVAALALASGGSAANNDSWIELPPTQFHRDGHTVTRLQDGRVLVAGGITGSAPLADAAIFDPALVTWSAAALMPEAISGHLAQLLDDGRVLVVARQMERPDPTEDQFYDPVSDTWSTAPDSGIDEPGSATRLGDGRVMVVDDLVHMARVFDPSANAWSIADDPLLAGSSLRHRATVLADGSLLLVGPRAGGALSLRFAHTTDTWAATAPLMFNEAAAALVTLVDGRALLLATSGTAAIYDPAADSWFSTSTAPVEIMTANVLQNGLVLTLGGTSPEGRPAQLFDPVSQTWSLAGVTDEHTRAILLTGCRVFAVGGDNGSTPLSQISEANMYDPLGGQADADGDCMPDVWEDTHFCMNSSVNDTRAAYDFGDRLFPIAERNYETDPCDFDTDDDGCIDGAEVELSPNDGGGGRSPLDPWDFFDVGANGNISLLDVLAILPKIGATDDGPPNMNGFDYDDPSVQFSEGDGGRQYDRTPSAVAGAPWISGPPNGSVTLNDALVALAQVGAYCSDVIDP